ncbi:MAG TPA: hypothetical protein VN044_04170 [Verrucomicrobiae bacterium]|nr:hypothetical protein [Verrucomicrobiae bacterium]
MFVRIHGRAEDTGRVPSQATRDDAVRTNKEALGVETPPFFQTLNVIAAIFLAKVRRAIVGLAIFCGLTRGSSFPEIRMPSTMQASVGNNDIWINCSDISARESWPLGQQM